MMLSLPRGKKFLADTNLKKKKKMWYSIINFILFYFLTNNGSFQKFFLDQFK